MQFQLITEFGGHVAYGLADLSVHEEANQYWSSPAEAGLEGVDSGQVYDVMWQCGNEYS